MIRLVCHSLICLFALCVSLQAQEPLQEPLPLGESMFTYTDYAPFAGRPVGVHCYLPTQGDLTRMPIIFVFEGGDRGYRYLMNGWKEEAERRHFILVIPHFGLTEFPLHLYQEVGVTDNTHTHVRPVEELTPVLVDKIFEQIRQKVKSRRKGYAIYGHSAGGQFVQRFMLFHDSPYVEKAIVSSPGWYTFPDKEQLYPYGTKNIPYIDQERIRRYIEKPITLQLALGDTVRESFLRKTPEAEQQGRNRLLRGRKFYQYLQEVARKNGWNCRWNKVEEAGIGHESMSMGRIGASMMMQDSLFTSLPAVAQLPSPDEVRQWFDRMAAEHPHTLRVAELGETPEGRRLFKVDIGERSKEKLHLWIQGALHGNEPAGPEAIRRLTQWLLTTPEGRQALSQVSLTVVPIANMDGYARQQRASGSGLDLNRDQSKLNDPVSLLLKQAYAHTSPDVALDIHEYRPLRREFERLGSGRPAHACDVLFLPSGHLNIPSALRTLGEGLFTTEARKVLQQQGYSYGPYFTPALINDTLFAVKGGKSPQSSSTFQALGGAVSLFIEIRGIGLGPETFERRSQCGFLIARNVVQTAATHRQTIGKQLRRVRKNIVKGKAPLYVTFAPDTLQHSYSFVRTDTGERFTATLPTADAMQLQPRLVRPRPRAYLLTASCRQAVDKLKAMGVEVTILTRPLRAKAEQYQVTRLRRQTKCWEGIHRLSLSTSLQPAAREFGPGDYLVRLNQPMGNLIGTLLEPESECGFVPFGVIPATEGEVLPIYRLP